MAIVDTLVVFVVSLLVGATGIYLGGRVVTGTESFEKAAVTALVGSFVWAIVAFLFGWIPLLGPLLALLAYVGVVNWQYPGGWVNAAGVALIAVVASIVILYVLALVGFVGFEALGVPGV
jgi:hypothetical protein